MDNWIFTNALSREDIKSLKLELNDLSFEQRKNKRTEITEAIKADNSAKLVILSGPGTGKSFLFFEKIDTIISNNPNAKILITTFVRKLADELQKKIDDKSELKGKVESRTLHSFAHNLLLNTQDYSNISNIYDHEILQVIWSDILRVNVLDEKQYNYSVYEHFLHDAKLQEACDSDVNWNTLNNTYIEMIKWFDAYSYEDQIRLTVDLIERNTIQCPNYDFIIVDEFQDFNRSEKQLIDAIANNAKHSLFVGDDDQVLYDTLRKSHKEYIRELYKSGEYNKAILPFCGRCSSNIVKASNFFLEKQSKQDNERVEKVFLPINPNDKAKKVKALTCYNIHSALAYLTQFLKDNELSIREVDEKLKNNQKVDPFLFVITPEIKPSSNFIKKFEKIREKIEEQQHVAPHLLSFTYKLIMSYLELYDNPSNNLLFRKILHEHNVPEAFEIVRSAFQESAAVYKRSDEVISDIIDRSRQIHEIFEDIGLDNPEGLSEKYSELDFIKKYMLEKKENKDRLEIEILSYKFSEQLKSSSSLNAIELLTYQGCKGLSAEHVIILGFDDVNMSNVTPNSFYVAMTRAKQSLCLLTTRLIRGARVPNQFLDDLPSDIEFSIFTKKEGEVKYENKSKFDAKIKVWNDVLERRKR